MTNRGIKKLDNGIWEFRFGVIVNGKKVFRRRCTDKNGNKLKSKSEAIKARNEELYEIKNASIKRETIMRKTFSEVFNEYQEKGRKAKAYTTTLKQDSLWKNHLCTKFGNRYIDDISSAEINDYLTELYYEKEYSYQYTESFIKMFYLIFGQANSRCYLSINDYNRLCVNKSTKITMPPMKDEDDKDIRAFSHDELTILDNYFRDTNAETAYLLGRYCGLRINEAFGLKWCNIDFDNGTITIDRQMQYQEHLIKLVPPKTRNANRTIYMNQKLKEHLLRKKALRDIEAEKYKELRAQKQRYISDLDGTNIPSTDLVNCLFDGTIQTVNSFKYPSREIKSKFGINFKYHILRHTYGTLMAEMNTPQHLLCNQMGHANIHVTQRYYLAMTKTGIDTLINNANNL